MTKPNLLETAGLVPRVALVILFGVGVWYLVTSLKQHFDRSIEWAFFIAGYVASFGIGILLDSLTNISMELFGPTTTMNDALFGVVLFPPIAVLIVGTMYRVRSKMLTHPASAPQPRGSLKWPRVWMPRIKPINGDVRQPRRSLIATVVGCCIILAIGALTLWRVNEHKQTQIQQQRRESLARRDLDLYAKSLEIFKADVGRYPTAQEGISALLKRPSTFVNWLGPYIEGDYSVDPWGNGYVYHVFNDGAGYELFTYGSEGEAAGRVFLRVNSGAPGSGAGHKP